MASSDFCQDLYVILSMPSAQTPGRVAKNVILNDSEESHRTIDAMIYSFFLEQNAAKEIKNEGLSTFF